MRSEDPADAIIRHYRNMVQRAHPDLSAAWPIISGHNVIVGNAAGWTFFLLKHTGNAGMVTSNGVGTLPLAVVGSDTITPENKEQVRARIERHFRANIHDAVFLVDPAGNLSNEDLSRAFAKHEQVMGLTPMKIFLSHKGSDKAKVREFHGILEELGFQPWLDEEALSAGTELERGILKGFKESCAAIFFITENFKDENYLASEVNYAIAEKRRKGDKFSIITLVFGSSAARKNVPELLHAYVWKEPTSDLQAMKEILRALPIEASEIRWKT